MRRNLIVVSVIAVILLFLVGCTGYQVPYQAPEAGQEPGPMPVPTAEPTAEPVEQPMPVEADVEVVVEPATEKKKLIMEPAQEAPVEVVIEPTPVVVEPVEVESEPVVEVSPVSETTSAPVWVPANVGSDKATLTVTEGELVKLNVRANDPDGDELEYTFGNPLDEDGEWQTKEGDQGEYEVDVSVTDGKATTTQEIMVVVLSSNKAPMIDVLTEITLNEGETITLKPVVSDPDGDYVTVAYSGWMTTNTKDIGYDEEGEYEVVITANDGNHVVTKTVMVTVEDMNRAPELEVEF
ncbi:hypothetical protein HN587_01680 [Candidatus Woesearchaeota archaeon]|jgi:hypothetical protein|nr:hypothetical protein [Candidatus Woesearchaeota archaeon]